MIYYSGVVIIILFNIAILYDMTQHNEEIYKSNLSLFLYVVFFFCLLEVLFFTLVYLFVVNSVGLLT